ncbi:WLM-domain-containing protein [Phellopilus nigrolimitatus]|nr:WLM-domain-containing protein [Phellopilus nigrolimitatus]
MVHNRFNEREAHPNKHINFITALPMPSVPTPYSEEDARQLLRALAAQVRPIMKSHGFSVNSFEEYEYNHVFAGRNWNNGETVELVLRRADGMFVSIPWLLSTLCHEHMNHGRDFQKLWAQLRMELRALQEKGYYGDGYWSSGTRIADSARVGGQGIEDIDLPDYVCGGAQTRSRPKSLGRRRRVQRRIAGPSKHTGAQTEKRRKPGTRVTAKGEIHRRGDEDMKTKGTGFRKQAGSKRAREERALAAERRLKVIQATSEKLQDHPPDEDSVTEDDSEYDERNCEPAETDEHRRRIMRDSMKDDSDGLNSSRQFMKDFLAESALEKNSIKEPKNPRKYASVIDAIESSEDEDACNLPSTSYSTTSRSPKRQEGEERPSKRTRACTGGRKLGSGSGAGSAPASSFPSRKAFDASISAVAVKSNDKRDWACHSLENLPNHLACSACGTSRGESTWVGQHE